MGAKSFSTFKENLILELGARTDITATVQGQYINSAYVDFCTRGHFWGLKMPTKYTFPELDTSTTLNTVQDRPWLTVPTDKLVTYTIHDTSNDKKLRRISRTDYLRKEGRADTDVSSTPTQWLTYGSKYYLYPTPDDAYVMEVFYRKRPTELSAATDVTAIGAEWDEVILKLAVIQSMMRLKDYEKAETEKKEWIDVVASKIQLYAQEMGDRGDYMKPDQSYHQWNY